jgi:hypothetical protein
MPQKSSHPTNSKHLSARDLIQKRIFLIRGQKVRLSTDLALLYGVEPRALVKAVKRNVDRFPQDCMFQLNKEEVESLKSHIVIISLGGHRPVRPYAFTREGMNMLSSILRSI